MGIVTALVVDHQNGVPGIRNALDSNNEYTVSSHYLSEQGVVCSLKENFGFIERSDVVREIFFHYSEYDGNIAELVLGDDVEFNIQTRNVSFNNRFFYHSNAFIDGD